MTYNPELADRVRARLSGLALVTEKAMFGGLAFLEDRAMVVAATSRGLMVRSDPGRSDELTTASGVTRVVMRGRELDGWLLVEHDVLDAEAALEGWIETGRSAARSARARSRA